MSRTSFREFFTPLLVHCSHPYKTYCFISNTYRKGDICNGSPEQIEPCYLKECLSEWTDWSSTLQGPPAWNSTCEGHQTDDAGQQCGKGMQEFRRECQGPHRCEGMFMKFEECYSNDCLQWSGKWLSC